MNFKENRSKVYLGNIGKKWFLQIIEFDMPFIFYADYKIFQHKALLDRMANDVVESVILGVIHFFNLLWSLWVW